MSPLDNFNNYAFNGNSQPEPRKYYGVKFAKVGCPGGCLPPDPQGAPVLGLPLPPAPPGLRSSPRAVAFKALSPGAPIPRPPREPSPLPFSRGALRPSGTLAAAGRGGVRPEARRAGRGSVPVATFPARRAALAPRVAPCGAPLLARCAREPRTPLFVSWLLLFNFSGYFFDYSDFLLYLHRS